jgi:hypothetical protein
LLEVSQGQDFAVELVHGVEGCLDADLALGADGRLAGLGYVAQQPRCKCRAGGFRQGSLVEADFPARVARLCSQVASVQEREALTDDEPQPEKERHVRLAEILGKASHRLDVGLLDHVGRINSALEPPVQA